MTASTAKMNHQTSEQGNEHTRNTPMDVLFDFRLSVAHAHCVLHHPHMLSPHLLQHLVLARTDLLAMGAFHTLTFQACVNDAGGQMQPRPPGGALFPISSGPQKPLPPGVSPSHNGPPGGALFPISQAPSQLGSTPAAADAARPQHTYSAGPSGPNASKLGAGMAAVQTSYASLDIPLEGHAMVAEALACTD